jgi:spore germination cell wall hydrolase CwlJ-like protein
MTKWEADFWVTLCVYFESRGEPRLGQKFVAHVIYNRAEQRNQSVKDVIFAPKQFSWANNGNRPAIDDYHAFINCGNAVQEALLERKEGFTAYGADHYHATWIEPPSWIKCMDVVTIIGQHTFYRST